MNPTYGDGCASFCGSLGQGGLDRRPRHFERTVDAGRIASAGARQRVAAATPAADPGRGELEDLAGADAPLDELRGGGGGEIGAAPAPPAEDPRGIAEFVLQPGGDVEEPLAVERVARRHEHPRSIE